MTGRWLAVALAACLACATPQAHAQPSQAQVRALFTAGAQAYKHGKFLVAAQAFEAAYKIQPKAALLFSAGQAYRRQWVADQSTEHLRRSVELFRQYLSSTTEGTRRLDAVKALEELEPRLAATTDREVEKVPVKPPTSIVVTTEVDGAQVSLDGGSLQPLPLIQPVAPGRHSVVVSAQGHRTARHDVVVPEGASMPFPVTLQPEPARLIVRGADGGELYVDGELRGELPLAGALQLPAGRHTVDVLMSGHHAFTEEVELGHGERRDLTASPSTTSVRTASYIIMGTGAATVLVGGVLGLVALSRESDAVEIRDAREAGGRRTEADRLDYNQAIEDRDALRLSAGVVLGGGVAVGVAGLLLFLLDDPPLPQQQLLPDDEDEESEAPLPSLEVSLGPSGLGLGLRGTF